MSNRPIYTTEIVNGRRIFSVDIGHLNIRERRKYIDEIKAEFKKRRA